MIATRPVVAPPVDEAAARRDLRRQIARIERDIAARAAFGADAPRPAAAPRLLRFDELADARDHALRRLVTARHAERERDARRADARARLEAMLADPPAHRHERVALSELGLPGCGSYFVKPRLGRLGALASWWEVRLSSGCP